mgnify:CR=1 FL=1
MSNKSAVKIQRVINATIERVFEAFTTPEYLTQWHHAAGGWQTPYAEVDPIVGGKLKIAYAGPDGNVEFELEAVFTKFEKPNELAYTFGDRTVEVNFEKVNQQTKINLSIDTENENEREMQLAGWTQHIDNLENHLEKTK